MNEADVFRVELSQQLIRKACETGCLGLRAQADDSTCLIVYPDHKLEWCSPCLMTRAAELLMESVRRAEKEEEEQKP